MATGIRFLIFYACMICVFCDDFLQNFDYDKPQISPYFHGGRDKAQYHRDEFLQNVPQKPHISSFKSDNEKKKVKDNFAGLVYTTDDHDKDESIIVDEPIPFISDGTDNEILPAKTVKYNDGDSKFLEEYGKNNKLFSVTPSSPLITITNSTFDGVVPVKNFKFLKMNPKKNNQLFFVSPSSSLASITNSTAGGVPQKSAGDVFKFVKMNPKKNDQLSFVAPSSSSSTSKSSRNSSTVGKNSAIAGSSTTNTEHHDDFTFVKKPSDNDNKFIFVTRVSGKPSMASTASSIATTTVPAIIIVEANDALPLQESLPSDLQCSGKDGDVFSISSCRRYYIKCVTGTSRLVACTNEHDVFSLSVKNCVRKAEARECADVTWWQGTKPSSSLNNTTEPETETTFCHKRVDGFYQHPSNCSRIVQCFGHDLFEYPPCAHNLAFDRLTGRCEYRGQVEGCSLETTGSASVVKNNNVNLNAAASDKTSVVSTSVAAGGTARVVGDDLNATLSSSTLLIGGGSGSSSDLQTGSCGGHSHGDHVVNKNDCSSFFRCVWDRLVFMDCPASTVFNPELEVCNYPSATKNQGCIMKA